MPGADRFGRTSRELRSATHRAGEAIPGVGAAGDCRPARRRSTRFASAAGSREDFALDDDQALHVLAEWNARCQPPWSPRNCSTSFAVLPGTAGSRSEDCFDVSVPRLRFTVNPSSV
jgi:hypothetical protein